MEKSRVLQSVGRVEKTNLQMSYSFSESGRIDTVISEFNISGKTIRLSFANEDGISGALKFLDRYEKALSNL